MILGISQETKGFPNVNASVAFDAAAVQAKCLNVTDLYYV